MNSSRRPGAAGTGLLQWQEQQQAFGSRRDKPVAVAGAAAGVRGNRRPGAAGTGSGRGLMQWQEQQQASGCSRNTPVVAAGAAAGVWEQQQQACCKNRSSSRRPGAAGTGTAGVREQKELTETFCSTCSLQQQKQHPGDLQEPFVAPAAAKTTPAKLTGAFCDACSSRNCIREAYRSLLWFPQQQKQRPTAPGSVAGVSCGSCSNGNTVVDAAREEKWLLQQRQHCCGRRRRRNPLAKPGGPRPKHLL